MGIVGNDYQRFGNGGIIIYSIDKEKYLFSGKFKGTSGGELTNYWNFRPMLADRMDMWILTLTIEKMLPANIIGIEFFGAVAVSYLNGVFPTYRRKNWWNPLFWRKIADKTGKQMYGNPNFDIPIYILDDVVTTGNSLRPVLDYFSRSNIVAKILILKNRSEPKITHVYEVEIEEIC